MERPINIDSFTEGFASFLARRKWQREITADGRIAFRKTNAVHEVAHMPDFRSLSRKKSSCGREQLARYTEDFFSKQTRGLHPISAVHEKNTLFTVAGVQVIDPVLFDEAQAPEDLIFVLQPSIRINSTDNVDGQKGVSTSFVNATTIRVNATADEHFEALDLWLEYLSSLGLFAGDLTLIMDRDEPDWGKGPFKNSRIDIFYGDLQLGDAVFIYDFPQMTRPNLTVSDIGFGLERIAWAVNKHHSYFDWIGPVRLSLLEQDKVIDCVRTMTLMAAHHVVPSNKAQGYRFRQLSKVAVENSSFIDVKTLVKFYHKFWQMFFGKLLDSDSCAARIGQEYNRSLVADMAFETSIRDPDEALEEIFLRKGRNAALQILKSKA